MNTEKIHRYRRPSTIPALPNIKNIIAVGSGKGGVGKSTVAANLALALLQTGARVGLLDADIYGPSQPLILGAKQEAPSSHDQKSINPVICHGLQTMSIGYLVDQKTAMIWRGPMVSGALQQLLNDTRWDTLDYLIIDLPPGTGDIQLTMAQKIPVSGAVIVTTPQDLSLLDARRAIAMFNKVNIPVLGVIENMSTYHCPACGHIDAIFGDLIGDSGGTTMAAETGTLLLGQLPLTKQIRVDTDHGTPTVIADPEGSIAKAYQEIAKKMMAQLSLQPRDYSSKLPKVTTVFGS